MIDVQHLNKTFENGNKVLDDVNFKVAQAECVVICGPSGAGKSTFLKCLNLLEKPTSGTILFDGQNILESTCNICKVRQKMGMVFQQFCLFSNLSILENITLGPIKLLHIPKKEATNQAFELLKKYGIADKTYNYPHQLSGGQQQRVAIIRALAMSPVAILFDEPTSALDHQMQLEVQETILNLKETNVTMVIITHDPVFTENVATRVIQMECGRFL
ncbi:MAG: amino acid ABC transporter ATP-binding protein [Oscillospiraceae bacterium]|jgi:polar amino acid transport system ATP-binding protein|nr:amino acid ABC transporter ATP-binding protein [Oscillospiraceae bacterium]